MDPRSQFCHNPDCTARGQLGLDNISVHKRNERRYRGSVCGRTFAVSHSGPDPRELYHRALVYARLGRTGQAEAALETAATPSDAASWEARGRGYAVLGRIDQAAADYLQALDLTNDPATTLQSHTSPRTARLSAGGQCPGLRSTAGAQPQITAALVRARGSMRPALRLAGGTCRLSARRRAEDSESIYT